MDREDARDADAPGAPRSSPEETLRLPLAPSSPAAPQRIGRYEGLATLGQGAMGIVYKARDPQLDRIVALKTLRRDLGLPPENYADLKKRFYQEATAAGRLNHPGIAAIHDVVEVDGIPYIVMEYLEGRTLAEILATDGRLDPPRAVGLAGQVCQALDYAHARGVVHRDIKPANIVVTTSGAAKVTDFGIARIAGSEVTQTGVMLGTPAYMSPEQLRGSVDARSDLFSLGIVLYEALTGVNPFYSDDLAAVLYQIGNVDPAPARTRNPAVSAAVDAALARVLAKRPEQRYPSAKAFAAALGQTVTPTGSRLVRPRLRRPSVRQVLVGAAALVLLSAGSWAVWDKWTRDVAREFQETAPPPESRLPPVAATAPSRIEGERQPAAPVPRPETAPAPARQPATPLVGSIRVTTDPSVEVFVDGTLKGRTADAPLVIPDVSTGEHRVTLRLGSREHTLRGRVREGGTLSLAHQFPAEPRPALESRREAPPEPPPASRAVAGGPAGCLSVNAVPFASVYVDGQYLGDTPRACLRVPVGERRIRFEASGERSPERVISVTEQHTAADPVRLSYDFRAHRFIEP